MMVSWTNIESLMAASPSGNRYVEPTLDAIADAIDSVKWFAAGSSLTPSLRHVGHRAEQVGTS